jgi:hypothetical protein
MNCYDCAIRGRIETAVVVCLRCGAGVCADCVRSRSRSLDEHGALGASHPDETRTMLCTPCAKVLADHVLAPAL